MVPDLLAGYSFLSAVTAKDDITGLPGMIGKTFERMTGLRITFDTGPNGFPSRMRLHWTGGPTIARGLSEYFGNLLANPDTYIATVCAIGPGYIRGYSPIKPGKVDSLLSLCEEAGTKSLTAIVAGTIFDPPPNLDTNTYAPADNPRGNMRGLTSVKNMRFASLPGGSGGRRYGSPVYREIIQASPGGYR